MYDFLIVGAGLFGSVFAHIASKRGKICLVIDSHSHIGGSCYTENIEGINVHKYGPHIFHTSDKYVWKFVTQFADFNRFTNAPLANYKGKIYHLPFNMNTFHDLWGVTSPEEALHKIEQQRIVFQDPRNIEEYALSVVGTDIYEKLIKGYTEKQWGRSCKVLPCFIVKRLPLRFTFDNNYFTDNYQGVPVGGYTRFIENILDGIEVKLCTPYHKDIVRAKHIVYTGSIDEYYNYKYGVLEYRGLKFRRKILNTDNFQGNAVVNYTAITEPYTRIIEHKHFEFGGQPKTVITYEYPKTWSVGDDRFYPINNESNNDLYRKYLTLAKSDKDVTFGGRLGKYKYMNMDETIASAINAANSFC